MEVEEDEVGWDKYVRVWVMIDIIKFFRRLQKIRIRGRIIITVDLKYERLFIFYFVCGIIGYIEKDYFTTDEEDDKR